MLIECQNCGAPLKVKPRDRNVRCTYCGAANQVQSTRTIAQQAPPGWQPPQQWLPPPQFPAPSVQFQLNPALVSKGSSAYVILIVVMFVLPMFGGAMFFVSAAGGGLLSTGGGIKTAVWDGKSTLHCAPNGRLTIENKIANVPNGPVVSAGTNCHVTVINSTLTGQTGIRGEVNVTIEMTNSRIEATQRGVSCGMNCKLTLREKSRISGKEVGVFVDVNAKLELRDSAVVSQEVAIQGGVNLNLSGRTCELTGGLHSIKAGVVSTIDLVSCKVQGPKSLATPNTVTER